MSEEVTGQVRIALSDTVYLNSGSPPLMVVGIDGAEVTVEWDGDPGHMTAPAVCFSHLAAGAAEAS
jgi:hypothetical protein